MSLEFYDAESRVEVRLIAAAKEHIGANKLVDRVVGNLLASSAKIALAKYGMNGTS